ncbi:MAG: phosphatidate cytidylyltransferase [Candidatus Acidiferrum sp.]
MIILFGAAIALLVLLRFVANFLKARSHSDSARATVDNLNSRIRAWWKMCIVFLLCLLFGRVAALFVFGVISFLAMREYMTLVPTHRSDHLTLFWTFFVIMPLQYFMLGMHWFVAFVVVLPFFVFAFIPTSIAIEGDTSHFLERVAKIQFGIMVCVYCLSHLPALLFLHVPSLDGQNARLLLYLVIVDQLSDVLQFIWGFFIGKRKIAWRVSPNKTWEGFAGGVLTTTVIGAALWWVTPFTPAQSAGISFIICILGFAGSLVMNAIKRDIGIKDFGVVIEGDVGILDRIDSFCFAAPIFFHVVRYYFAR